VGILTVANPVKLGKGLKSLNWFKLILFNYKYNKCASEFFKYCLVAIQSHALI
jgi:hypothetical protein